MQYFNLVSTCFACQLISLLLYLPIHKAEKFRNSSRYSSSPAPKDPQKIPDKIIAGGCATKGQFPFVVSIQYTRSGGEDAHNCGGTLIDSCNVLTAGHCCDGMDINMAHVAAGVYNVFVQDKEHEPYRQIRKISKIVIHPYYQREVLTNDICVLQLNSSFTMGENVAATSLPTRSDIIGDWATVPGVSPGWGRTVPEASKPDVVPECLKYANLTTIGSLRCGQIYAQHASPSKLPRVILPSMICAYKPDEHVGVCIGDSGGPLLCKTRGGKTFQAGIVSSGAVPCGHPQTPGIYTNVYAFLEFINQSVKRHCN